MTDERRDALEAVAAALIFGRDVGLACEDMREDGREDGEDGTAYPGAGNVVDLSAGARDLLADAMALVRRVEPVDLVAGARTWDVHGEAVRHQGGEA